MDRPQTPVRMYWAFSDDNTIEPRLTIEQDDIRDQIFDTHDVDSLSELKDQAGAADRTRDELMASAAEYDIATDFIWINCNGLTSSY